MGVEHRFGAYTETDDVDFAAMWTGIIAVIAFSFGFFLASLLACGKAAYAEMERMRKSASSRNDRNWGATRGPSARQAMSATRAVCSPGRHPDGTVVEIGYLPAIDAKRRVEAT